MIFNKYIIISLYCHKSQYRTIVYNSDLIGFDYEAKFEIY